MSAVHEDMHQRAGEEQEKRQCPDDMREVFGQQEICRHAAYHHEADGIARTPEAGGRLVPVVLMVRHGGPSAGNPVVSQ